MCSFVRCEIEIGRGPTAAGNRGARTPTREIGSHPPTQHLARSAGAKFIAKTFCLLFMGLRDRPPASSIWAYLSIRLFGLYKLSGYWRWTGGDVGSVSGVAPCGRGEEGEGGAAGLSLRGGSFACKAIARSRGGGAIRLRLVFCAESFESKTTALTILCRIPSHCRCPWKSAVQVYLQHSAAASPGELGLIQLAQSKRVMSAADRLAISWRYF